MAMALLRSRQRAHLLKAKYSAYSIADPNWRFVRWGGALANDVDQITVTITGNLAIAADYNSSFHADK